MSQTATQNGVAQSRGFSFTKGPGQNYPILDKSLYSILYLIRDLIWILLLSVPIFIKTILELFMPKPEKDVTGQVIVITGAGNGMGQQMAIRFARLGSKIACVDISKEGNARTLDEIATATGKKDVAKSFICDLSDAEAVKKLADEIWQQYGKIDILIHNAALLCGHDFLKVEDNIIRRILEVNFVASFWVLRSFINLMKKQKYGHVVVTNSITSSHPLSYASSYSAAKAGLLGLVDTLDMELKDDPDTKNIKFSSIHPYFVRTHDNFMKYAKIRVQGLHPSEAARQMVIGIRREYRHFTVPWVRVGYFFALLIRLFPIGVYHLLRDVAGGIVIPKGVPYVPPPHEVYVPDEILKNDKKK